MTLTGHGGGTRQGGGALRGVLLMAYGSPDRLEDLAAYYTHVRGGRAPSAELLEELKSRYLAIGGRSPLNEVTARQAAALQRRLDTGGRPDGVRWKVYVGMRHWRPWIAEAIRQMAADGVEAAVGVALAPHDSRMSVGAYIEAARQALATLPPDSRPAVRFVRSWADQPRFVEALASRLARALKEAAGSPQEGSGGGSPRRAVVFTAHSLPRRILSWDDPYPREVERTCRAVAARVGLDEGHWLLAYQSQGRTPEPWLGPSLEAALRRLAGEGVRHVVVCPVGFVSDHLEVLYDIDIEAARLADELGMRLTRTPSLNDDPDFIEALAAIVAGAGEGWTP